MCFDASKSGVTLAPAPSMNDLPAESATEHKGDLIYAQLSAALIRGALLPNARLKIRALAEQMGTSVTPVRDALLRLVQDGALVMPSPRDIRVRQLSLQEYLEIRSIRLELEGMAAGQAAIVASDEDVQRLQARLSANEAAMQRGDVAAAIALNQSFHFELSRVAQMPMLTEILKGLWMKMGPLIAQSYQAGGREMIEHHYPIVDAIARRDSQAARVAMQTDILAGGRSILAFKEREAGQARRRRRR